MYAIVQTLAGAAAVNNRIVANAITIWALIRNLMMCFILLFFFSVTLFVLVLIVVADVNRLFTGSCMILN
ncbi:hypothetical protein D3C85_1454600 [compost metagenome]